MYDLIDMNYDWEIILTLTRQRANIFFHHEKYPKNIWKHLELNLIFRLYI